MDNLVFYWKKKLYGLIDYCEKLMFLRVFFFIMSKKNLFECGIKDII